MLETAVLAWSKGSFGSSASPGGALGDEARYHRQLDKLAARARGRRLDALVHDGVRFAQILDDRERVVAALARAVAEGSYEPLPPRVTSVRVGNKTREMARASALDLVVHAVLAEILAERIEPELSDRLYSYRRGRSSWQAVRWLASRAREHEVRHPDVTTRGLYVLRADVARYTDSIPVSDDAPIWKELDRALPLEPRQAAMMRRLLRPAPRDRGFLFGLPTTNVIGNLYLTPLDRELERRGSYARFGDDVLFADEDPARVKEALALLRATLRERGLDVNDEKLRVLYWNGAPRPSAVWPEAVPSTTVRFLGADVRWNGVVALAADKWRGMLVDVKHRIRRTARILEEREPEARARVLATVMEECFDPRSELALAHAPMLLDLVSDRAQLEQLDYLLALWIAEAASGRRGPRAFRDVPYRWLRREAKLSSRVVARNAPTSSRR